MPWKVTDNQQMPDQGMPFKGEMSSVKNIPLNTEEMLYKMKEIMHGLKIKVFCKSTNVVY